MTWQLHLKNVTNNKRKRNTMGNANINLDEINEADGTFDKEPVPEGWYTVTVKDSEVRETKAGDGQYVTYEFYVQEAGKRFWQNYNFDNPNEKATRIARAQIKTLCTACGKSSGTLSDFSVIHGKSFRAKLRILPAKDGYAAKNEIAAVEPLNKAAQPHTTPADADEVPFG